ncbi:MAG: hypothetical protein MAG794_01574 [Gammaproteobacteria bacterium]|nr:hypothetical protein [Gammaproteobacteria bacterium]
MKKKSNRRHAVVYALGMTVAFSAGALVAQDDGSDPTPPELASGEGGQATELSTQSSGTSGGVPPTTQVRQHEEFGQKITEYGRQGNVFLITVKPRIGLTQYWNDLDGDGQFQRRASDNIDENVNLPKWRLGGW